MNWPLNSANTNSFEYQISAYTDNFDFLDKIWPKTVFPVQNRKSEHTIIELGIFELVQDANFIFNWQVWLFDQIFPQKLFPSKTGNKNNVIEFCIFKLV